MGVVFDEVVSQVEPAPEPLQSQQEQTVEQSSPQDKLRCWQQQEAIVRRRQNRLEAD